MEEEELICMWHWRQRCNSTRIAKVVFGMKNGTFKKCVPSYPRVVPLSPCPHPPQVFTSPGYCNLQRIVALKKLKE